MAVEEIEEEHWVLYRSYDHGSNPRFYTHKHIAIHCHGCEPMSMPRFNTPIKLHFYSQPGTTLTGKLVIVPTYGEQSLAATQAMNDIGIHQPIETSEIGAKVIDYNLAKFEKSRRKSILGKIINHIGNRHGTREFLAYGVSSNCVNEKSCDIIVIRHRIDKTTITLSNVLKYITSIKDDHNNNAYGDVHCLFCRTSIRPDAVPKFQQFGTNTTNKYMKLD